MNVNSFFIFLEPVFIEIIPNYFRFKRITGFFQFTLQIAELQQNLQKLYKTLNHSLQIAFILKMKSYVWRKF